MAYELAPLPYSYDALEPAIPELTMRVHHDKHHAAYVTNVNAALEGTEWADPPVEQVVANLDLMTEGAHRAPQQPRRPCEPLVLRGDPEP